MSEPSAWAKGQWADLKNQPGTLKEAVILALDSAWRAGARAKHHALFNGTDDLGIKVYLGSQSDPDPGGDIF